MIAFDIQLYDADEPFMDVRLPTHSYREGVHSFHDVAEANKHGGGFMFCPCVVCRE